MVWALSFLEGRARRLPPRHPPSTPRSCPPKDECRSLSGAWRAARRWTGVPRPGVEDRLPPPRRAPAGRHIDRLAYQVGAHVVRHRVPDCFLRAAAGDGRQVHEPLPGADIGDIAHPPALPACWRRESRRTRSGREPRARGRDGGAGSFRRGCAATRPCSRMTGAHRLAVHAPAPPRPQGRGDAPVPAGFRPRHRAQS